MKSPILGKQTSLHDNPKSVLSFHKYIKEVYERNVDNNPLYTGRYFAILKQGIVGFKKTKKLFESKLGFTVANTRDFINESFQENQINDADALIYEDLGIALLGGEKEQIQILESAIGDFTIVPEKVVYVPDEQPANPNIPPPWGINITRILNSQYTGNGIKLAVLDTGFDISHPDFIGRSITASSFVPNETVHDLHGHGTHCTGTACGSTNLTGQRYGIAKDSLIYAGKVLNNNGSGAQAWILNGMMWAVNNACKVISMSLGSKVSVGQSYDIAYERAALFALSQGTVVVAAAGNESKRSINQFSPVTSPADCPSVVAVAALDTNLNVADFSNRSINPSGQINIAGPGVMIYSSWPMPVRYRTISGTSMATPHVAGIVALICEKYPAATSYQIMNELNNLATHLPLLSIDDIGIGLSIAP